MTIQEKIREQVTGNLFVNKLVVIHIIHIGH